MPDIELPTLHESQALIYRGRTKRNAVRCGRRWGKTEFMVTLAGDAAAKGKKVGLFTPEHKQLQEPYERLLEILQPIKRRASKTEGTIRTKYGGLVDFWSLTDNELAGRGRDYDLVMVDEAAFTKNDQMQGIWERSIEPTMLIPKGDAWVFSTPNGEDPKNFFWWACNDPKSKFKEFHAPTNSNPLVSQDEFDRIKLENSPLVFAQEYLAKWVSWAGARFFQIEKCLVGGQGVDYPTVCDTVFVTIDSASKAGPSSDGTGVCYWALSQHYGHPVVLLDWDIVQLDSDLLITWLPTVFQRAQELAVQCRARTGFSGALIEDKASGIVLLQHGQRHGWPVQAIDSKFTALGKDQRAIAVSGHVHQEKMKLSKQAHDKQTVYKTRSANHFALQFFGYQIGVKDQQDDLLDCGTYGLAAALGNSEGF
jgi:hypothetical protein